MKKWKSFKAATLPRQKQRRASLKCAAETNRKIGGKDFVVAQEEGKESGDLKNGETEQRQRESERK